MTDTAAALIILAAGLAAAALLSRAAPLATRVLPGNAARVPGLDGLRGILATSVLAHHAVLLRQLAKTGEWREPSENLANLMGQMAVAIFFMVSAYLFLGKIFRSKGKLAVFPFAWGRLLRLTPVYLLMTGFALFSVWAIAGFSFQMPLWKQLVSAPGWIGFGFMKRADINGVVFSGMMISPVWSLRYEWILYCLIPVAAFALRRGVPAWGIILCFFGLALLDPWFAYFALGGLAFQFISRQRGRAMIWGRFALPACIATLAGFFHTASSPMAMVLAFVAFLACLTDHSLVRVLERRAFVYAGQISYSIYLLHLPILFVLTFVVFSPTQMALWSDLQFLVIFGGAAAGALAVATLSYIFVEKPGMELAHLFKPSKGELGGAQPMAAP